MYINNKLHQISVFLVKLYKKHVLSTPNNESKKYILGGIIMFVIDQSLSGYPELSQGDTGADVRCLEYCLHILNCYGGAFDGIFGPEVNAATRQFQVRHALGVDGIVGPQTWGSIIPRITEIQIALNAAGISVEVDGLGGPQTLNGVINFQESAQVVDSGEGYVGPITREVMFGGSSCIDISGYPELSQGNTGADVRCLEYCLHILNCYAGAFDGIFGPEVFNAAEQLQERNYIGVDGIVGPQTWGVIIPRIKEIQVALNATGASLQVDGLGGPETLQAVINFQNASGFSNPQGYVGPQTRGVLFGSANEDIVNAAPSSGSSSSGSSNMPTGSYNPNLNGSAGNYASPNFIYFIKGCEGFAPSRYSDIGGTITDGYGMTGAAIQSLPNTISEATATSLLTNLVNDDYYSVVLAAINSGNITPLQREVDALTDFAYNEGTYALINQSTLFKKYLSGVSGADLEPYFLEWDMATVNGQLVQSSDLRARRELEWNMFCGNNVTIPGYNCTPTIGIFNTNDEEVGTVTANNGYGANPY